MARKRALWKCPRCGNAFVTANLWHSCGRYRLAEHFEGKEAGVRKLFARFRELVRECGPVTVYAQKTRIVFQTRVRFAGVTLRKKWLDLGLWFPHRVTHRTLRRVEVLTPRCIIHEFRLQDVEDLDAAFATIVREAYAVGLQEHLRSRPMARQSGARGKAR
ncbi:MAG: DUF5655 domain-containing protein [Planctomycetota bacterium]